MLQHHLPLPKPLHQYTVKAVSSCSHAFFSSVLLERATVANKVGKAVGYGKYAILHMLVWNFQVMHTKLLF